MLSKPKSYGNVASPGITLPFRNWKVENYDGRSAKQCKKKSRFDEPGSNIKNLKNYFTTTLPVAIRLAERSSRLTK
jgi:hypothetical protein